MKRKFKVVAALGALAAVAVTTTLWVRAGLVSRLPVLVEDLPPYGGELRGLPPYDDSPSDAEGGSRPYQGPGWYPRHSANGRYVAATESWRNPITSPFLGLLIDRPYIHTVGVWDEQSHRFTPVVSIMEADPASGIAHRYAWSKDSKALLIYGGGRLADDYHLPLKLCLVYLPKRDELYRLSHCPGF